MRPLWFPWLVLSLLGAGCFQAPELQGPFRCDDLGGCGAGGLVCDDGVCCSPLGEPRCRSFVLDGGTCADGSAPKRYYQDLDRDGFGNESASRMYCAPPVFDPFVDRDGDCNDSPENEVGKVFFPGAEEICDGQDNDCDGERDEGLERSTFYLDQDGDGFGDPASPVALCAPTAGFSTNQADCGPTLNTRFPGAPELCNGLDDDCDGVKDENPLGVGDSCLVEGGQGLCLEGKTACISGALSCQPLKTPTTDVCDGLDNDCDGATDEQPDCGGPSDLMAADSNLTRGARNLGVLLHGGVNVPSCVKDLDGGTNEFFSSPTWSGSTHNSHVFWVETSQVWDLSKPGASLQLSFAHSMLKAANPPWSVHGQPVVYLCDSSGGHSRFVHFNDAGMPVPLMTEGNEVSARIPLAGSPRWVIGANVNIDLTKVKRLEVLVQPNSNPDGGVPSFNMVWPTDGGFGFRP